MPDTQGDKVRQRFTLKRVEGFVLALVLAIVSSYLLSSGLAWAAGNNTRVESAGSNVQGVSDLSYSSKYAERSVVFPGGEVPYKIKLVNWGMSVVTATVTDTLPTALNYVAGSASNGGVYAAGPRTVTWQNISVPAHNIVLLSVVATATTEIVSPTWVVNTATIASAHQVFDRWAVIAVVPPPIVPPHPILAGSQKIVSQRFATISDTVTYTINLVNSGGVAGLANVIDPLPWPLALVPDSVSAGGVYNPMSRTITWEGVEVPAGSSTPLTFAVVATGTVNHPMFVLNTAFISTTGEWPIWRQAAFWLVPQHPGDIQRPLVKRIVIGEQDVLTSPTTTLHISATDNVSVSQMFIREWRLVTTPFPQWTVVQSSGWVPYQPDYPWTLTDHDGVHFVGVWVADASHNISRIDRSALDFASLVRPGATVPQKGLVPYLVYYPEGVSVTSILTPTAGDADLYVWYPHSFFWPDQVSAHPLTTTEIVSFTTPRAGTYLFLVHGYLSATYDLSIAPAGGPYAAEVMATAAQAVPDMPSAVTVRPGGLTFEPVLSQSGLDPLATAPTLDDGTSIYLPMIHR